MYRLCVCLNRKMFWKLKDEFIVWVLWFEFEEICIFCDDMKFSFFLLFCWDFGFVCIEFVGENGCDWVNI